MGARKKSEDGEDGAQRTKKPNNFWAPFNTWWREHHERTGNRATVVEMREWYAQHAHTVWSAEVMPTVEDMLKIAKGLRTIKQVQAYFRSYRKNLKTRKEGDPASPDAHMRRGGPHRRHPAHPPIGSGQPIEFTGARSLLEVMQQAAQHFQAVQHAHAVVTGAPGFPALGAQANYVQQQQRQQQPANAPSAGAQSSDSQGLPFLEWGFTSEAAAMAAMEAIETGSDGDGLSDAEDGPTGLSEVPEGAPRADNAAAVVDPSQQQQQQHAPASTSAPTRTAAHVTGVGALVQSPGMTAMPQGSTIGSGAQHAPAGAFLPWMCAGSDGTAGDLDAAAMDAGGVPPQQAPWMPVPVAAGAQYPHRLDPPPQPGSSQLAPGAALPPVSHRRTVRAVRTSVGGGPAPPGMRQADGSSGGASAAAATSQAAVFHSVGGSAGCHAGMQAVTCRRTRIRTLAGGVWQQQEVVEQLEVEMTPRSPPMAYGYPVLSSYGQLHPQEDCGSFGGMPLYPPPQNAAPAATSSAVAAGPTPMIWHGRSTAGGTSTEGGDGSTAAAAGGASTAGFGSCPATAMQGVEGSPEGVHVPPRKQLRCGDRGVVSMGGCPAYDGPMSHPHAPPYPHRYLHSSAGGAALPQHLQESGMPPAGASDVSVGVAGTGPNGADVARRYVQSYGGTPAYPPPVAAAAGGGLRHKAPHGAGTMALSDGGVIYGSQVPVTSAHHPHAPPPYRGLSSSYGGVTAPWPHHHPNSHSHAHNHGPGPPQPIPPHHHPAYPSYPSYGYRHPGYPPHPAPSYGYHPHSGYAGAYHHHHMPSVPYGSYGHMHMNPYGSYYHGLPETAVAAEVGRDTIADTRSVAEIPLSSTQPVSSDQHAPAPPPSSHRAEHPHPPQQQHLHHHLPPQHPSHLQHHPSQHSHEPQHRPHPHQQPQQPPPKQQVAAAAAQDMAGPFSRHLPQGLQPLQLAELPPGPVLCGGLTGSGGDSLSHSDLAGLSGLSALGLAESDTEGEEAASGGSAQRPQALPRASVKADRRAQSDPDETSVPQPQVSQEQQQKPQQQPEADEAGGMPRVKLEQIASCNGRDNEGGHDSRTQQVQQVPATSSVPAPAPSGPASEEAGARHQSDGTKCGSQAPASPATQRPQAQAGAEMGGCPRPDTEGAHASTEAGRHDGEQAAQPGASNVADRAGEPAEQQTPCGAPRSQLQAQQPGGTAPREAAQGPGGPSTHAVPTGLGSVLPTPLPFRDALMASCSVQEMFEYGSGDFGRLSDGGTTDGAASVYYKTPKLASKPLALLPDDPVFGHTLPGSAVPSSTDFLQRQLALDLLSGPGTLSCSAGSFSAAAATAAAMAFAHPPSSAYGHAQSHAHGYHAPYSSSGGAGGTSATEAAGESEGGGVLAKSRGPTGGGPPAAPVLTPMTIHVLQEEVVVMPHLGASAMASLGDLTGLHSPTISLNLGLLDQAGDDCGDVVGMWGS